MYAQLACDLTIEAVYTAFGCPIVETDHTPQITKCIEGVDDPLACQNNRTCPLAVLRADGTEYYHGGS